MSPNDTDNDNVQDPKEPSTEPTKEPKSEPQPKPEGKTEKTYTEAEYKGLQAVISKRDQTIAKLTNERDDALARLAEAEANHGSAVTEKTNLSEKLTAKEQEAADLQNEVAKLAKQIERRDIIMKEFPDLSPFTEFIPAAEDADEYREKAKEFKAALGQATQKGVQQTLSGSSPPIEPVEERTTPGVDPVDEAYRKAMALAGRPDKQQEYEEAYREYTDLLDKRKQT